MPPVNRLAIFSCDPGGATGIAWGIVDLRSETVVEAMTERTHSGSATIGAGRIEKMKPPQFQEAIRKQVGDIQKFWDRFVTEFMYEYDRHGDIDVEFVCEHFVLTGGRGHKPGIEGIFPAFMVGALIMANPDETLILQTASKGMKWNKRDHLTAYNAWVVGREHERAAFAHFAARVHERIR